MNKTKAFFPVSLSRLFSVAGFFSISLFLFLGVAELAAAAQPEGGEPSKKYKNNLYIVHMADAPVVAYKGGITGLNATKPAKGKKLDATSVDVVQYSAYLDSRHDAAVAAVKGRKVHGYKYTFNGFAAELTPEQAERMKNMPGVVSVDKDELRSVDTSSTPSFLGLNAPGGLWSQAGGVGNAGENVVIGVIDTGIWPEHPSFSDRTGVNGSGIKDGKLNYQQLPGWNAKCTPGDSFTGSDCNQKIISAQYFNAGWGGNAGITALFPFEFNSPRDWDGHGSHTASTAGGNNNVLVTGEASVFGSISGMAPRARISVYKVCWANTPTGGGCSTIDSVAAIDQAVADGVDVINYSISGTSTNFRDPVEIAFMFAADAGVFVAASAGNSGPTASTVAHPGPWLTTVAAGTHNREAVGKVTLGNAAIYSGASTATTAVGPKPLIDAIAAGLPGADPTAVRLCFAAEDNGGVAVLDPAKVAGKIVVCDRGIIARVNKSLAVKQAGGLGVILVNTSVNSLNADFHYVPTVHLQVTDRAAVKAYAATAGATATISQATLTFTAPAPFTASFSSRGPLLGGNGDLLKPDLIAPGQDVLAAIAPPANNGRLFDLLSGTSMSSPHVAGLAAAIKGIRPDWSPMAIKSALMTTGYDVLDGGTPAPNTSPVLIFRQGAGHVKPNSATNPGLVFDAGIEDWLGFLCGTQLAPSYCTSRGIPVLDPSNLNVASIAIGDLAGVQTVIRSVTNVGGNPATYTPSYTGMAGFNVVISPATLTLAAGATKSFTVTFTRTTATLNAYTGGQLTLTDGVHNVRIPMVVRPVALAAPAQVGASYNVIFGYTGAFSATPRGLVPAATAAGAVATGGKVDLFVTIPAGTTYARISLFDANVSQASDLDLEVRNATGTLVGSSGSATSAEEVNLLNPAAGVYKVSVVGFAVPVGSANFTLFNWSLGSAAAGNMTVTAPASATTGATGAIGIATSGLTAGTKYLGSVVYAGAVGLPNPTIVRIDP